MLDLLANIRKAKLGRAFMSHVRAFPVASTVIMTAAPAYVRLGFEPILTFDGKDRIEVPPDVVRRRGSHIVMQKKLATGTTTVPVPEHDELRIGTLRAIIRQSGVARTEFEE